MIDIKTTLDHLRSQASETEILEFKEAKDTYSFKKLGKYFSALSNEANLLDKENAWLVFGIKDSDKSVVDTSFRRDSVKLHSLKAEIANKTTNLSVGSLFPEEVDSYDPYIVREALNNCIAHQDYTLGGKINVVEREDSQLIFTNMGSFIPQTIENVIEADAPEPLYRNPFLAEAMVNLKMIDTIGSGIKRMFNIQRKKFFPLPEYSFSNNQVKVVVTGKVLDMNYSRKIAQMPGLSLTDIMLLDKVQKNKPLTDTEIKQLRRQKLIEGRKPNFHISAHVASKTGQTSDYMKSIGIDDEYCKKIIVDYLLKFGMGKKADFEKILLEKLPDVLNEKQKKDRLRYILQKLRKTNIIKTIDRKWHLVKTK